MKTKIKLIALLAGLLAALPMTSAWAGGGSTSYTYYSTLKVGVASCSPTGSGTVYAATDSKATSGSASVTTTGSSTGSSKSLTIYGNASPNTGFQFDGWSEKADGSGTLTSGTKYTYTVTSSDKSSPGPTKSIYAVFSKIVLPEFSVTCAGGNYTVNGGAPGTLTQTEAVTVTLASADPNFFCWKINGTSYTDNPHVQTFSTGAEISAQFLTAESVVEVTTYEDLKSALANDQYLKITVPSGASLTVAKGDALTVPAGKALVLNRPLIVAGTFTNNGMLSGGGKVLKVSYMISQGDVIKLYDGNGEECGNMDLKSFKPHYRPTTVTANTPSVTMGTNAGCGESWAVTFGGNAYTISKQSPMALKVTLDTAVAANHIKSIADGADVDSVGDHDAVLLADCSVSGYLDSKSRGVYTKTVDCAGKKATVSGNGGKIAASNALFLNGSVSISPSSENQNSKATFINCTSVTLSKIKGVSPAYGFYACGTKTTPLSLSFGYYNSTRGDNYRTAYFHNGYYKYTFNSTDDGGGKCVVKGGNFRGSDPTAYIPSALNDVIWAPEDKTANYFVVQPKAAAEKFVSMNGVEYESLEKALEDAPDNTKTTIELIAGLDLTGSTVTIGANKNIYLRLSKHLIEGAGKIVNNGTLTVTDSAANECTVACSFENRGTLEFIFGKYTGDIVNKAGTLTVHNGVFTGSLTKDGGAVNLKGGCFANDISSFVTADGYRIRSGKQPYCVCEMPDGTLYDLSVKGVMGYGATPYALSAADGHSADYDILSKYVKDAKKSESDYSAADWPRLAELVTFADVFNGKALDATLIFDRFVKKSSLTFNVKAGSDEQTCDFYFDLPANAPYRGLTEFLMRAPLGPYYAKTYEDIFAEEIKSVGASIVDKSSGSANAGTVCTFEIELWQRERGPNYVSNGEMITNTICVVGSRRFTLGAGSNVAMIRPATGAATFYPTLKAACEAAQGGETVMLANDCTTCEAIAAPCSFRFDANGFAAPSGAFAAADGFELSEADGVYTVVAQKAPALATIGDAEYETLAAAVGALPTAAGADDLATEIVLGKDCAENLTIERPCKFVLTTSASAAFSGTIAAGENILTKCAANGEYWFVTAGAKVGETLYETLGDALLAVAENGTVVALADVDEELTVGKVCSVDMNGFDFVQLGRLNPGTGFLSGVADGVYRFYRVVATIGGSLYSSLASAVNSAKRMEKPVTIELKADTAESVVLPEGVRLDESNGKATALKAPAGYAVVKEGDVSQVEIGYVAVIGGKTFETLAGAIAAVREGETVKLVKATDEIVTVAVECTVNGGDFVSAEQIVPDAEKGFAFDGENTKGGVYVIVHPVVATVGGTGYETLAAAIAAGATGTDAVVLQKNCGESVVLESACTFGFMTGDFDFFGSITAAEGLLISRNGDIWTVSKVTEVKTTDAAAADAGVIVKVDEDLAQEYADEEALKADVRQALADSTKKVSTGFAEVATKVENEKVLTEIKQEIVRDTAKEQVTIADLNTGIYQPTKVVEVKDGKQATAADEKQTKIAVIKNAAADRTLLLVCPGDKVTVNGSAEDATVANVIASAPTEGDTIEVYDDTALVYRTWTYGNDVWTPQTVAGVDKQAAAAFRLAAGKAFRYVRAESNTAPVVVAANYEIKEITTTILEPGSEVGKESWNLVGNPNPSESFDLNEIKVGETTGDNVDLDADKVIVPTVHGGRKLYTLELDQTTNRKVWGYDASEVVVRPNGLKIRRNVRKTDDTKIAPGQVIWYLSGEKSAKPSFQWQK